MEEDVPSTIHTPILSKEFAIEFLQKYVKTPMEWIKAKFVKFWDFIKTNERLSYIGNLLWNLNLIDVAVVASIFGFVYRSVKSYFKKDEKESS